PLHSSPTRRSSDLYWCDKPWYRDQRIHDDRQTEDDRFIHVEYAGRCTEFAQLLELSAFSDGKYEDDDCERHPCTSHADQERVDELLCNDVRQFLSVLECLQVLVIQSIPDRVEHRVDDDLSMQSEEPEQLDEEDRDNRRRQSAAEHRQWFLDD